MDEVETEGYIDTETGNMIWNNGPKLSEKTKDESTKDPVGDSKTLDKSNKTEKSKSVKSVRHVKSSRSDVSRANAPKSARLPSDISRANAPKSRSDVSRPNARLPGQAVGSPDLYRPATAVGYHKGPSISQAHTTDLEHQGRNRRVPKYEGQRFDLGGDTSVDAEQGRVSGSDEEEDEQGRGASLTPDPEDAELREQKLRTYARCRRAWENFERNIRSIQVSGATAAAAPDLQGVTCSKSYNDILQDFDREDEITALKEREKGSSGESPHVRRRSFRLFTTVVMSVAEKRRAEANRRWGVIRDKIHDLAKQRHESTVNQQWLILRKHLAKITDMENARKDLYVRYGVVPNAEGKRVCIMRKYSDSPFTRAAMEKKQAMLTNSKLKKQAARKLAKK